MFVCFFFLECDFYFVKWIFEVCVFLFLDYSFYFVKWIFEVCVFLFGIIVFTL